MDRITEQDVFKALENREMQVYYQPQYDTLTKGLRGAEALVRWFRSDGSLVMPGAFIPMLEESSAILALDWYMTERVCEFLDKQKKMGICQVPISINYSRRHVQEARFVEQLCEIADRYQVSHRLLIVEIMESVLEEKAEQVIALVKKVREAGFKVAIDDFGSGLSSLSFVKDISVDYLKIDRSLLSGNCEDEKERIVLESIFMFAHRLKWTTVAEGVETTEQFNFLKTCDCKLIQGYLFAKPMPEADYLQVCRDNSQETGNDYFWQLQETYGALNLLMEAVLMCYPLIIMVNLSRDSYYMMAYDNFSTKTVASAGTYEELIAGGAKSMHPEDRELFTHTFSVENQLAAIERGEKSVRVVTRQLGDDGIYRRIETTNYFVNNPYVDDVFAVTLSRSIEE
ncbi:MAG: EAL domain-containing protein [Lachnospiraceae bacterium]|nr:EAL domain-containing protein [Lachnospiraceae bacterium]